jgi:hypothetical protein
MYKSDVITKISTNPRVQRHIVGASNSLYSADLKTYTANTNDAYGRMTKGWTKLKAAWGLPKNLAFGGM